jgi:succinoglycan biosynthesis transport protein ExoP
MSKQVELRRSETSELMQIIKSGALVPKAKPILQPISLRTRQELRKLVQRLFLAAYPNGPRVVVFTSVDQGNGCSWTCARIAEVLADTPDWRVCLIDANHKSPGLSNEFHCENPHKLSDAEWSLAPIKLTEDAFDSNLWLLAYRPLWDSPSSASLEGFQKRLAELHNHFRFVLIDAPPLSSSADAAILGGMTDGAVIVLAANDTRREPAKKAKQLLNESGVPLLGAVLNKRVFPVPETLYRRL